MEVHERIKALRTRKCYTQACVARRIGSSQSNYAAMEIGCRRIYVDDIVAICQIFHKRLDYYLFGIEKDTPNTYFIRVFSELSKEDQIEVLNYIEFRHQLSEEPIDPQTIFYQLYSNKE